MNKTSKKDQTFFYILIRSYAAFDYLKKSLESILSQNYKNYLILYVDDASNYSKKQKQIIKKKLLKHIAVFNTVRKFSVFNAYNLIHKYGNKKEAVVLNLDGDDWLINKNVLNYLNKVYKKYNCWLTYGECFFWDGKKIIGPSRLIKKDTNLAYPANIIKTNNYRNYPFLPLHPRTWKVWLFKKILKESFTRQDGSWLQFAEDQAMFYPMLEMATSRYKVIKRPLYVYNVVNKNSDLNKNLFNLLKDELTIRKKRSYKML